MTQASGHRRSDARRNRDAILAAALEALSESPDASLNAIARRGLEPTLDKWYTTRRRCIRVVS